jgi:GNAT superfamily N-acetyltransferase
VLASGLRLLTKHPLGRALRPLARTVATSLYSRQCQHITVQGIGVTDAASFTGTTMDRKIQCVIVDSPDALEAIAQHVPATFRDSVDELKKRVAQGCVLSLALRPNDAGGAEIVGYELAERGVFSALGRRLVAPPEVIFSHWAEVLPEYRGRRIHALLFAARDAYFRRRGGKFVCGVVDPRNRASLQALARAGSFVVGTVTRIALFQGLLVWETPRERIEYALQLVGEVGRREASWARFASSSM